jgi:hypothetical protein
MDTVDLKVQFDRMRDSFDKLKGATASEMKELREYIIELKNRQYCERHIAMSDKLDTVCSNTEVIKAELAAIKAHVEESKPYRAMTLRHDEYIKSMRGTKSLVVTTLISILVASIGIAATWGEIRRQVVINTQRLNVLEAKR